MGLQYRLLLCVGLLPVRFFVVFFFMVRRPLLSTLFPYTTLFRSSSWRSAKLCAKALPFDAGVGSINCYMRPDRKSTRLNSSHVRSSYAVFCLKKKTHSWALAS